MTRRGRRISRRGGGELKPTPGLVLRETEEMKKKREEAEEDEESALRAKLMAASMLIENQAVEAKAAAFVAALENAKVETKKAHRMAKKLFPNAQTQQIRTPEEEFLALIVNTTGAVLTHYLATANKEMANMANIRDDVSRIAGHAENLHIILSSAAGAMTSLERGAPTKELNDQLVRASKAMVTAKEAALATKQAALQAESAAEAKKNPMGSVGKPPKPGEAPKPPPPGGRRRKTRRRHPRRKTSRR